MNLTEKQRDQLWGESGPYSEARLLIEHRLLDDAVTRVFLRVEVSINPFTFQMIAKHRDEFKDDKMIQQLLDNSEYFGQANGYVSVSFQKKLVFSNEKAIMAEAQKNLEQTKRVIIKMHKYIMKIIDKPAFTIRL